MSKKKITVRRATRVTRRKLEPKITKLGRLEAMLRKPEGATIEQLSKALDWKTHSVRGAIAGSLKKKGISVSNEQPESGMRVYRIV